IWPDGSVHWIFARATVLRDAKSAPRRMLGVNVDINERKLAEEELARHRRHLERLVSDRTAELEASQNRLRLSERMAALGTLAAGLGHDMGNLLVPVRVRLEVLDGMQLS